MQHSGKLFSIQCNCCGAPVGFDIPSQSYRCTHCGQISQTRDARIAWSVPDLMEGQGAQSSSADERELEWRKLNAHNWNKVQHDELAAECTSCGARVLFQKEDASETCPFCGSNLVQSALYEEEELPEYIIPFVLTEEEAQNQLRDWAKSQKENKDTRRILQNVRNLKGYYLPYQIIRGSVEGTAYRDPAAKKFHYRGFLDYALVNASGQMDNEVLDAMEPYDLSALRPFEPGYIGGHRVKLRDVSEAEIQSRTIDEAAEKYRPYVAEVLHNRDAAVRVNSGDFFSIPVLLPVYVQKVGKYIAVVNGQTGKTAAASNTVKKKSKAWLIEPTILTLLAAFVAGYFFQFWIYAMLLFGSIAALVFYTAYGKDRNTVFIHKIYRGQDSRAGRKDGELEIEKGNAVLKNPFSSTPVFYEKDGDREVRVEIQFYSPARILSILLRILVLTVLPAILAAAVHLVSGNNPETLKALHWGNGAAWYVLSGAIAILYWIRGVRWELFNRPILYEILPDGTKRLLGDRKSRRLSVFSLFGMEKLSDIAKLGGAGMGTGAALLLFLIGSTFAILM